MCFLCVFFAGTMSDPGFAELPGRWGSFSAPWQWLRVEVPPSRSLVYVLHSGVLRWHCNLPLYPGLGPATSYAGLHHHGRLKPVDLRAVCLVRGIANEYKRRLLIGYISQVTWRGSMGRVASATLSLSKH